MSLSFCSLLFCSVLFCSTCPRLSLHGFHASTLPAPSSAHVHGFVSLSFAKVSEKTSTGPRNRKGWGTGGTKPGAQLVLSPSSEQTNNCVWSDSIAANSFTARPTRLCVCVCVAVGYHKKRYQVKATSCTRSHLVRINLLLYPLLTSFYVFPTRRAFFIWPISVKLTLPLRALSKIIFWPTHKTLSTFVQTLSSPLNHKKRWKYDVSRSINHLRRINKKQAKLPFRGHSYSPTGSVRGSIKLLAGVRPFLVKAPTYEP